MKRCRRRHNYRLIHSHRSYTISGLAKTLGVHINTIHRWHTKEGLKYLDGSAPIHLVLGSCVRSFLKARAVNGRCHLQPDEYFCCHCHAPRKSLPAAVKEKFSGKLIGKCRAKQVILKGICEVCGTSLTRFSSDKHIKNTCLGNTSLAEHVNHLSGSACSSLNSAPRR